jgi:hypothetical protein
VSHDVLFHRLFDPPQRGSETSISIDVEYGHTYHCAARMNWGDGDCECGIEERRQQQKDWDAQEAREENQRQAEFTAEDEEYRRLVEEEDRCALWDADQGHFD